MNDGAIIPNIVSRAWSGFAKLVVALALLLFVSAGSFRFWQAWVFLGVFAGGVGWLTFYLARYNRPLLARRLNVGPAAETQRRQKWIQGVASGFILLLFLVPGLDFRFRWSRVPAAVSVAGDAIVALGFLVMFLVFRVNTYTSAVVKVAPEQRVITNGPYRFVRHPMYFAATLLYCAAAVALGSWFAVPTALGVVLTMAVRAVDEERLLNDQLPGYRDYVRRVRWRLFPFIW